MSGVNEPPDERCWALAWTVYDLGCFQVQIIKLLNHIDIKRKEAYWQVR